MRKLAMTLGAAALLFGGTAIGATQAERIHACIVKITQPTRTIHVASKPVIHKIKVPVEPTVIALPCRIGALENISQTNPVTHDADLTGLFATPLATPTPIRSLNTTTISSIIPSGVISLPGNETASPVPEAATWMMIVTGFGFTGLAMRRPKLERRA